MKTRLTVTVSAYGLGDNPLFTRLIFVDKDLTNVPPIEVFVEGLQMELLPDFQKENSSIASIVVESIVIIDSGKSVAHTVWPKPDKKGE
ncbi:hypothetical protein [Pantoea ananatis]|uniref:hypothetical protein n=1 Tax=Pantoea ananas TaxID=553 RepID=UPI001B315737|nr:hypothetical protein [Pantoea ananatis]